MSIRTVGKYVSHGGSKDWDRILFASKICSKKKTPMLVVLYEPGSIKKHPDGRW